MRGHIGPGAAAGGGGAVVPSLRRIAAADDLAGQGDCIWESLVDCVAKRPSAGAVFTSKTPEMGLTRGF